MKMRTLKTQYKKGTLQSTAVRTPRPFRREAPEVKSLNSRITGAVHSRSSHE